MTIKHFVPALVALGGRKTMSTHYYGNVPYFLCSIFGKGTFDI